jgi:hypothetical protein
MSRLRGTGFVGGARDVARRIARGGSNVARAVTDVDVWAALARDTRRAVLLLDGPVGHLFGHDLGDDVASACGVPVRVDGEQIFVARSGGIPVPDWLPDRCVVVRQHGLGRYEGTVLPGYRKVRGPRVARRDLRSVARVAGVKTVARGAVHRVRRALRDYVANIIQKCSPLTPLVTETHVLDALRA